MNRTAPVGAAVARVLNAIQDEFDRFKTKRRSAPPDGSALIQERETFFDYPLHTTSVAHAAIPFRIALPQRFGFTGHVPGKLTSIRQEVPKWHPKIHVRNLWRKRLNPSSHFTHIPASEKLLKGPEHYRVIRSLSKRGRELAGAFVLRPSRARTGEFVG